MIRVLFVCPNWKKQHSPDGVPLSVRQLANSLNETGEVHVQIETVRTGSNPINYFSAWGKFHLQSQLRNEHDIVHCHWGYMPLVVYPSKKPIVVTLRGGDVFEHQAERALIRYREKLADITTRYFSRRARRVIVVSRHLGVNLGGQPFEVIPNGVDLRVFHPMDQQVAQRALGLSNQRKIVLFGGAAENRVKNFALAEKVCRLSSHNPILITLNGVPHETVAVYMNASDALLVTSHREGSPNVLKEALACGLPVLSVDVGDVAEQMRALSGCKVVRSYEPQTLAKELDVILSSRQRISGPVPDLDQKHIARKLIDVYTGILSHSR
jgi:glycosyltransferase involved in cell wall biosynthesis